MRGGMVRFARSSVRQASAHCAGGPSPIGREVKICDLETYRGGNDAVEGVVDASATEAAHKAKPSNRPLDDSQEIWFPGSR